MNNCGLTEINVGLTTGLFNLSCNDNPDLTKLDISECVMLNSLFAQNCAIEELNFGPKKKLQYLNLANNKIRNIDIKGCSMLKEADLSDNQIEGKLVLPAIIENISVSTNKINEIDFSKATRLVDFSGRENQLTTADFTACRLLRMIDLYKNNLTSIETGSSSELVNINVDNNNLTSLDITKVKELRAVSASQNQLRELNLVNNKFITSITIQNNQLTKLDLDNNNSIQFLDIQNNKIESLDLSKCNSLTELRTTNNNISSLKLALNISALKCCFIENNKVNVETLNKIIELLPDVSNEEPMSWEKDWKYHFFVKGNPNAARAHMDKAKEKGWITDVEEKTLNPRYSIGISNSDKDNLHLSIATELGKIKYGSDENTKEVEVSTDISNPTDIDIPVKDGKVTLYGSITYLKLDNQKVKSIDMEDADQLEELIIPNNEISTLNISNYRSVKKIDLSNNKISSIDLPSGLTYLNLSKNDIKNIQLTNIERLNTLNISSNKLASLNLDKLGYLHHLNASNNKELSKLSILECYNLETVNLDSCNFATVNFEDLTMVSVFSAINNSIKEIDLTEQTALKEINLKHNKLSKINLSKNTNLTTIDLSQNELTSVVLPGENERTVYLYLNRLDKKNTHEIVNILPKITEGKGILMLFNKSEYPNEIEFNEISTEDINLAKSKNWDIPEIKYDESVTIVEDDKVLNYSNETKEISINNDNICQVYNLSGERLLNTTNQRNINLSYLENGIYIIKVNIGHKSYVRKIIIK